MNKVNKLLVNEHGDTYFIRIETDDPVNLVRGLWESIDEYAYFQEDNYFKYELTDRAREFRVTTENKCVCIRTHAWHPSNDKQELHKDVLSYLSKIGLDTISPGYCHCVIAPDPMNMFDDAKLTGYLKGYPECMFCHGTFRE